MSDQILTSVPLSNPSIATIDGMVGEVASLVGGEDDPEVKAKALKCLDRAADRLNMAGVFLYRRKEVTFDVNGVGDLDLDSGDSTLTLPSDWGWPEKGAKVLDSSGNFIQELQWTAWEDFTVQAARDPTNANAVPQLISIRNEIENLAHIFPPVDVSKLDQIVLVYFARILRPSEVGDENLLASQETVEALISGGEAFMMRFREKNQPQIWLPFMRDFEQTATKAKAVAHRNQQVIDGWAFVNDQATDTPSGKVFISLD